MKIRLPTTLKGCAVPTLAAIIGALLGVIAALMVIITIPDAEAHGWYYDCPIVNPDPKMVGPFVSPSYAPHRRHRRH